MPGPKSTIRLLVWQRIQSTDEPAVRTRGHQDEVALADGFLMDHFAAVEDFHFQLGIIQKLHFPTIWSVEESFYIMTTVGIANCNPGAALVLNALCQVVFGDAGEVVIQQISAIRLRCGSEVTPRIS